MNMRIHFSIVLRRMSIGLSALLFVTKCVPTVEAQSWMRETIEDEEHDANSIPTFKYIFTHSISLKDIEQIAARKDATRLDVGYFPDVVKVDGEVLAKIGDLSDLEDVSFYINGVQERDWSFLEKLPKLKNLVVDGEKVSLGDDFLQVVSKLKNLEYLRIHSGKFSDRAILLTLASLDNLTGICVQSPLMTDRTLNTLGRFKKLKSVQLASPHFTDAAAKRLTDSREWEWINVILR